MADDDKSFDESFTFIDVPDANKLDFFQASSVKEYETQISSTMHALFLQRKAQGLDIFQPWSMTVFGCVLLADISGFTKLANKLDIETLKFHINNFFTILLSCVRRYKGDVVKFCGDAVLVVWTIPQHSPLNLRAETTRIATNCGLQLMSISSRYRHGVGDSAVSLRLHCGLSAGDLHLMCLGDSVRKEFLISGAQLKDMGSAAKVANTGDLCLSHVAYEYIRDKFDATELPNGNYKIEPLVGSLENTLIVKLFGSTTPPSDVGSTHGSVDDTEVMDGGSSHSSTVMASSQASLRSLCSGVWGNPSPRSSTGGSPRARYNSGSHSQDDFLTVPPSPIKHPGERDVGQPPKRYFSEQDESLDSLLLRSPSSLLNKENMETLLLLFVHQSARASIVHNSLEYLSQLRQVVTMFIEIMNLDEDFNSGKFERPQLALSIVLQQMASVNGALRQYVVDDKGCVLICNFGVPGFSCINDSIKAIYSAHEIIELMTQENIACRIGIARGPAFCGYVGSRTRREYSVMGSSVNLAARLMGKSKEGQVWVNSEVYFACKEDYAFEELDSVQAKGYKEPVHVYRALRHDTTKEHIMKRALTSRSNVIVGFENELSLLHGMLSRIVMPSVTPIFPTISNISFGSEVELDTLQDQTAIIVVGEPGGGKSTLVREFITRHSNNLKDVPVIICQKTVSSTPYTTVYKILRRLFYNEMVELSSTTVDYHVKHGSSRSKMEHENAEIIVDEFSKSNPFEIEQLMQKYDHTHMNHTRFQFDEREQLYDAIHRFVRKNMSNIEMMLQQSARCQDVPDIENLLPFIRIFLCSPTPLRFKDTFPGLASAEVVELLQHLIVDIIRFAVFESSSKSLVMENIDWCDFYSYFIIKKLLVDFSDGFFLGTMTKLTASFEDNEYGYEASFSEDDIKDVCAVVHLPKLNRNCIRQIIEHTLGPHMIEMFPEVLSAQSITSTLVNSSGGNPRQVVEQAEYMQREIGCRYFGSSGSLTTKVQVYLDSVPESDKLILRTASVCGAEFKRDMLEYVFRCVGYNDIIPILEKSLVRLMDSNIISDEIRWCEKTKSITYSFVNPDACAEICSLMMETQKQAIHSAIVKYYLERSESLNPHPLSSEELQTLTNHISQSNNIPLEIEYTCRCASLLEYENKRGKACMYYSSLIKSLCGGRSENDLFQEALDNQSKSFSVPFLRRHHGSYLSQKLFFQKKFTLYPETIALGVCESLISLIVAKMSSLKFKEMRYKESNKMFLLALHIQGFNLTHPLLMMNLKPLIHEKELSLAFADLFVQQSDLFLQLGKVSRAKRYATFALHLVPSEEDVAYIKATSLLCSISIFMNRMSESNRMYSIIQEYESHNMEFSFSFRHLHLALKALSFGDFNAARHLLTKASTKRLIFQDVTAFRFSLENFSRWLHLIMGEKDVKFSDSSFDCELRDIWVLQENAFLFTFKGYFNEAAVSLATMKERQKNCSGSLFYSALLGYFGVRFQHHTSDNRFLRDECWQAVIFSGGKLNSRTQATPIGILCVFLTAYSALTIMLPPMNKEGERIETARSNAAWISHYQRVGDLRRLKNVAKQSMKSLASLCHQFPFLQLLKQTLAMLQSCVSKRPLKTLRPREIGFRNDSSIEFYREFTLGCAFWYEVRLLYCVVFDAEGDQKENMLNLIEVERARYCEKLGCNMSST